MSHTVKEIRIRNLQKLIVLSGLSKGAFALKIETSPAYLSQIGSRKTKRGMGDLLARKIELAFKKPKGWMDNPHNYDEFAFQPPEAETAAPEDVWRVELEPWDGAAPVAPHETLLPLFKESGPCAAAAGRDHVPDKTMIKMRYSKATLEKLGIDEKKACCIILSGNSMEPVLPAGTTLGVDGGNTAVRDGDIYAIDHFGCLRVKILYHLPGGGFRLRSFNSLEWPDEHVTGEALDTLRIVGRVFWWCVVR